MLGPADIIHALAALSGLQPHAEDDIGYFVLDALEHLVKHAVALMFVLDLRVLLRISPQHDAFLKVIHRVKMVLPCLVINLQKNIPLQIRQFFSQKITPGIQ